MPFVIDASVVAAWLLPDETSPGADTVLERTVDDTPLAPDLLLHEIRNILLMAERRGRIEPDDVHIALKRFDQLSIERAGDLDHIRVVDCARRHTLSAYDAAYLALAIETECPLATLDRKLMVAAGSEGVELLS